MNFVLKPFKELIAMSKEKLDEALIPVRAAQTRAKAAGMAAEMDEKILRLEVEIQEMASKKDLDLNALADRYDDLELLERRQNLIRTITKQLFPET